MAYKIILREDGWFDAGKDCDIRSAPKIIYESKQKLKEVITSLGSAPSLPVLKENLDCKLEEFNAVALPGFDGRPYFHKKEIRIAPSAAMPDYCVLGEIVSEKVYAARMKKKGEIK